MRIKILIVCCLLCTAILKVHSNDTIRYELLKLEKIKVDTLLKTDNGYFIGCFNLFFRQAGDSLMSVSFISLNSMKNSAVVYSWDSKPSIQNFCLSKGAYYKLFLMEVCASELETDCFYKKYANFSYDKCSLSCIFSSAKYQNDFEFSKTHYVHKEALVYKVLGFSPTNPSNESGEDPLKFLPINLAKDKNTN